MNMLQRVPALPSGPFLLVDFTTNTVRFLARRELETRTDTSVFAAAATPGALMWLVRVGDPNPRGLVVRLRPNHICTVEGDPPAYADKRQDEDGEGGP